MKKDVIPYELIEALQGYLDRCPEKKKIKILSSNGTTILMGDMPSEIKKRTKIGIDYEKSLYKMAFEDLIRGNKVLEV